MKRQNVGKTEETNSTLRALRRAARRALTLGVKTGTPVYIVQNNKIIDLTKRSQRRSKRTMKVGGAKTRRASKHAA